MALTCEMLCGYMPSRVTPPPEQVEGGVEFRWLWSRVKGAITQPSGAHKTKWLRVALPVLEVLPRPRTPDPDHQLAPLRIQ